MQASANEKMVTFVNGLPRASARFTGERASRDYRLHQPKGFKRPDGFEARMCAMALKDACEPMERFWAALADAVRPLVDRKTHGTEPRRHDALGLLYA
jgi:hypothetical protein